MIHSGKKIDERMLFIEAAVCSYAVREDDMEDFECTFEDFNIERKELIFFPMNDSKGMTPCSGSHWSLLIFDREAKGYFRHFDSAQSGSGNMANVKHLVKKIFPFLKTKHKEYKIIEEKTPQQKNHVDCGPYVCRIVELLSQGLPILETHFQVTMPKLRAALYDDIMRRNKKKI